MTRWIRLAVLAVVLMGTSRCGSAELGSERFFDALIAATRTSSPEAVFRPSSSQPYSVVLFRGPTVNRELLRKGGLDGGRLEGVAQAAPKDFKLAVAVVTSETASVGWFLGNYVISQQEAVVQKNGNDAVTILLKYGGSLPEITAMK